MKKLILVRHAKSSWEHQVTDHERPLNERGFQDANLVSNNLNLDGLKPDLILCSDSVRTITTASIFTSNLNIDESKVIFKPELYDFTGGNLVNAIKNCDDTVGSIMLFGHNHAITSFVNTYGHIYIDNVPTCGVVVIGFLINKWKDLNKGKTIKTVFPRDLRS